MTKASRAAAEIRDRKRALNICINGQLPEFARKAVFRPSRPLVEHGPPLPNRRDGKCAHCVEVHKRSRERGQGRAA